MLESVFPERFSRAVYEALAMLEAVNINKEFLIREAGSPDKFKEVRDNVQRLWTQETMDQQLNQKAGQKVLNILYLMEIRSPGFTTVEKLHKIHDLAIANLLDTKFLSRVTSDTTPEQADAILAEAERHQENSNKAYPDLTPSEEAIWNRVKVYHEFPDGFRWVYAIDANGNIAPSMPSNITNKTMRHCGNNYAGASKDDQYWELRDSSGKAYLTVILTPDGKIQESKSYGNQVSKYKSVILPYVKWFLMNRVHGVTHRYNYGYAANNNFGVKDFMLDDPEFVDYVVENRPELVGSTEGKILFWKGALDEGLITIDQLKEWYIKRATLDDVLSSVDAMAGYRARSKFREHAAETRQQYAYRSAESIFGYNPFEVLCSVCGGNPFNKEELKSLIDSDGISLDEFANYNVRLLDDDVQVMFVSHNVHNMRRLVDIAGQVASFKISDRIMSAVLDTVINGGVPPVPVTSYPANSPEYAVAVNRRNKWHASVRVLLEYISTGNPPDKVKDFAVENWDDILNAIERYDAIKDASYRYSNGRYVLENIVKALARFNELRLSDYIVKGIRDCMMSTHSGGGMYMGEYVLKIGRPRMDPIFEGVSPKDMVSMIQDRTALKKMDSRNVSSTMRCLAGLAEAYPGVYELLSKMNPTYRLGAYCFLPREKVNMDDVLKIVRANTTTGEAPKRVPSAKCAVTFMAICKFPEVVESEGMDRILVYTMKHASELEELGHSRGEIITPALSEMLAEYLDGMDDAGIDRQWYGVSSIVNMFASIHTGGTAWSDREKSLMKRMYYRSPGAFTGLDYLKRNGGPVDIPYEEWDAFAERHGKVRFIRDYLLERYVYQPDGQLPSYLVDYLADYIVDALGNRDASNDLSRLLTSEFMRSRRNKPVIKAALCKKLAECPSISRDELERLNRYGMLTKDEMTKLVSLRLGNEKNGVVITHPSDAKMYVANLDQVMQNGKLLEVLTALFRWVSDSIDNRAAYGAREPILLAGKIAKWCSKNRKNTDVIDAIPTDLLDGVIEKSVDAVSDTKWRNEVIEHQNERQEKINQIAQESDNFEERRKWRRIVPVDWSDYKRMMSAIEAMELMRRRVSYQVDMFDKDTRK